MSAPVESYDYKEITDDLCQSLRDRAFQRGEQVRIRSGTLTEMLAQGSNITTARERADAAVVAIEVQALKVEGEIAVAQAKLRYLDHLYQNAGI